MGINKHEKEDQILLIIDSIKEYFDSHQESD
jgi:hypothetical protein